MIDYTIIVGLKFLKIFGIKFKKMTIAFLYNILIYEHLTKSVYTQIYLFIQ